MKLRTGHAFTEETADGYAHPPCPFLFSDDWIHCMTWNSEDRDLEWWIGYFLSYADNFSARNMMDQSFRALAQYLEHPATEGKMSVNGYSQLITWNSWYFEKSIQTFGRNPSECLELRKAFSDHILRSIMQNASLVA